MSPQRLLIKSLDQPGLRRALGKLGTAYARAKTGLDAEVFYDGAWIRRVDRVYLAEFARFAWNSHTIKTWKPGLEDVLGMHRGWWYKHYTPKTGDLILDIGAGVGEDTLAFAKDVGPKGRVIAVEAHPRTFAMLVKTCAYNGLDNVVCVQKAIMDKPGSVSIEDRDAHQANTISVAGNGGSVSHSVPAVTLDDLCREHSIDRIEFLKMNIEGAEQLAIGGMTEMIKRTKSLCIACHDFLGDESDFYKTREIVSKFLKAQGFTLFFCDDHPDPWARDHVHGVRA